MFVRSGVTGSNQTQFKDVFSRSFVTLRWTHSSLPEQVIGNVYCLVGDLREDVQF